MTEKVIIFDAGPIISLTMSGLLTELRMLKEKFSGKFLITKEIKEEVIDRPMNIKRFELEALKVQELINDQIIEFPESFGIKEEEITTETEKLIQISNNTFFEKDKPIHLLDKGETSALILSRKLSEKKIENVIAVDERTMRMLCEKPENLRKLLQKKLHSRIDIRKENLHHFKGFKIVRSTEIMYMAYKKNALRIKDKKILDAILFALKYKGCSISIEEIKKLKKIN